MSDNKKRYQITWLINTYGETLPKVVDIKYLHDKSIGFGDVELVNKVNQLEVGETASFYFPEGILITRVEDETNKNSNMPEELVKLGCVFTNETVLTPDEVAEEGIIYDKFLSLTEVYDDNLNIDKAICLLIKELVEAKRYSKAAIQLAASRWYEIC